MLICEVDIIGTAAKPQDLSKARDYFQQAIEKDPMYALPLRRTRRLLQRASVLYERTS